jgi:SAM-dependent methyltransferase
VHPTIKRHFHAIVRRRGVRPARALEVGGVTGRHSLLNAPEIRGAERYCLNLIKMPSLDGVVTVAGNANDMRAFKDGSFDLVLCNATLEHDKRFWLSVAEMKRVLAPGGLLVIGVPGYVKDPVRDHGLATHTYRVHYRFDYYRFSEQAVREVLFEGMQRVRVSKVMMPPRLIGHGVKPRRPRVTRVKRLVRRLPLARRAVAQVRRARRRR